MRLAVPLFAAALPMLLSSPALAGSFGVSPIRIDLSRATRTAVVEVTNDDQSRLSFQAKLVEWTQDAEGEDVYLPSSDLVFFPPLFTVNPGEKRIVRMGTKAGAAPGELERSYRLYIEELPPPAEAGAGAQLRIALRFGLPVFVAPATPARKLVMEDVRIHPGRLTLRLRSTGNQSSKLETIRLRNATETLGEGQGWYVLADRAREFDVKVDPAKCPLSGPLELEALAQGVVLARQTLADPASLCKRP